MPRKDLDKLEAYISSLVEEAQAQKTEHPLAPMYVGPGWPRLTRDLIAHQVMAELSSPGETRRLLIGRLKKFLYPYPQGTKKGKTFYDRLDSLGLLDVILNPPLLWDVRSAWSSWSYYVKQRELKEKRLSQHKYPLEFHRQMMTHLIAHLEVITKLAKKNEIPEQEWLAEYYTAIRGQLLREVTSYYPELLYRLKPAHKLRVYSHTVDVQVETYHAIIAAFKQRNLKNNKLAYQLTALICTPSDCAQRGKLDPNPERVRKYVRDWKKRHPRRLTKGRTKTAGNPSKKA